MAFSFKDIFKSINTKVAAPDTVVGIDIGSAAIKVVELEKTDRAITLKTYGELQTGPYAEKPLGDTVVLETEKKKEALIDIMREAGVETKSGILAMPLASSFVTVVPLVVGKNEDLEAKIPVEARKYIPIPLHEVMLDWAEIKSPNEENQVTEVLLAAVQTEAINAYNTLMAAIGMVSQPSEIEVFSTLRTMRSLGDTVAVIDLGARVSKLYLTHEGALERIHRVSVGGAQITRRVAEMLSMEFEAAENLKRNIQNGAVEAADIKRATTATLSPAFQEFKRIIDQYEAMTGRALKQVVCTGGVAAYAELIPFIQDSLGRPVMVAEPFTQVAYPAFMEDTLRSIGPTFTTSLGAALRMFE